MRAWMQQFDRQIIHRLRQVEEPLARGSIFIVYFWFGLLKALGVSPAGALVEALFAKTLAFMPFETFYLGFAFFEMIIGVLFLMRGAERLAIFLLGLHLIVTILPLVLLPHMAWQSAFVPTLTGQYIIKNILIAALGAVVGSKLIPMKSYA